MRLLQCGLALSALLALTDASRAADFAAELRAAVESGSPLGRPLTERAALAQFYEQRGGGPAWWDGQRRLRGDLARELLEAVQSSQDHGLRPQDYHAGALARALESRAPAKPDRLVAVDVLLSDAFLHLERHLAQGSVDPQTLQPGFERVSEPAHDGVSVLGAALESGAIGAALAQSAPPHAGYRSLVRELVRLREARDAGRADQLRANLERWRWLPRKLGARHLLVNAAAFRLQAFDGGALRLEQRVVVGEPGWKTPLVSSAISHVVLNPAWRVPRSIATKEMLPAAKRDPDYFRAKDLQVLEQEDGGELREIDSRRVDWRRVDAKSFRYHLRQPPGPHNPLGRIKFSFASPFGVYLHGTPGDRAFARGLRALSHGCVRVEDEVALAEFALAPDPAWTHARLLETLRNAWEYRLPLPQPLPIHLVYFTATARADGAVDFEKDPYGWDRALLAALDSARAQGAITTGVPIALRAARKSMSGSASPMQP